MLRQVDSESAVPLLGVFDGACATRTVIRPCLNPPAGQGRIDVVTRLREDAQLHASKAKVAKQKRGRPRLWGKRLPAPKDHEQWQQATWQESTAYIYGRQRRRF